MGVDSRSFRRANLLRGGRIWPREAYTSRPGVNAASKTDGAMPKKKVNMVG